MDIACNQQHRAQRHLHSQRALLGPLALALARLERGRGERGDDGPRRRGRSRPAVGSGLPLRHHHLAAQLARQRPHSDALVVEHLADVRLVHALRSLQHPLQLRQLAVQELLHRHVPLPAPLLAAHAPSSSCTACTPCTCSCSCSCCTSSSSSLPKLQVLCLHAHVAPGLGFDRRHHQRAGVRARPHRGPHKGRLGRRGRRGPHVAGRGPARARAQTAVHHHGDAAAAAVRAGCCCCSCDGCCGCCGSAR
eukprot:3002140-Rhodomonas_salina.1